jgi:hypothetical protein
MCKLRGGNKGKVIRHGRRNGLEVVEITYFSFRKHDLKHVQVLQYSEWAQGLQIFGRPITKYHG